MKKYSLPGNTIFTMRYLFGEFSELRFYFWGTILLCVLSTYAGIYLPKVAVGLVTEGASAGRIVLMLGGFGVLIALLEAGQAAARGGYFKINSMRQVIWEDLFLKSIRVPYPEVESGKAKTRYAKGVRTMWHGDNSATTQIFTKLRDALSNIICFLLFSMVIGTLNVWLVVLLLAGCTVNYFMLAYVRRKRQECKGEEAKLDTVFYYLRGKCGDLQTGKDIRIYGMGSWIVSLQRKIMAAEDAIHRMIERRVFIQEFVWFLIELVIYGATYYYLIGRTVRGEIGVDDFVLYFGAITGFSDFVTWSIECVAQLQQVSLDVNDLREVLDVSEEDLERGNRHISELSTPYELRFEKVSFSYPGDGGERIPILTDMDLVIRAGEKLALVGVNGAGKTTIVKLLCGLYEPDRGRVLLNGVDIREFPKKEIFAIFSAVFQEAAVFPFTVAENIAMCRREEVDDERAWEAVRRSGLGEVFAERGITLDDYMTKMSWKGGIVFSGGEQQRFMLARALYKDSAVLILDEPTAALDPIAESRVYELYAEYTKGKSALFISHRLASTRFADRIVLLGEGRVLEEGAHEELLARGGRYAQMFEIQKKYYEEKETEEEGMDTWQKQIAD